MTLNDLLKDYQTGQDETQLQSFVLGGRTPWGTYKQALRELYKRVRGLRQMQTDIDLLLIDIEELELSPHPTCPFEYKRTAIKIRQKQGQLEEANRSLTDLKREAAIFYRTAAELKLQLGDITPEKRVELDRAEWMHWHLKKAALDKLTTGRISEVVLKNLYSIPLSERMQWFKQLEKNPEKFIEDGEYGVKAIPPPTEDDIKLLEQEIADDNLITD